MESIQLDDPTHDDRAFEPSALRHLSPLPSWTRDRGSVRGDLPVAADVVAPIGARVLLREQGPGNRGDARAVRRGAMLMSDSSRRSSHWISMRPPKLLFFHARR